MTTIQDRIAGLYAAFFNRAPDNNGFDYWTVELTASTATLEDISAGFAGHPTFANLYGGMDNQSFVEAIYVNMLNSAGDAGGISFWVGKLDNTDGYSRSDMVAEFVGAVLDVDLSNPAFDYLTLEERTAAEQRQTLMQNKVLVSQHYIAQLGSRTNVIDALNPEQDPAYLASIQVLADITSSQLSATTVMSGIDLLLNRGDAISILNAVDAITAQNIAAQIEGIDYDPDNKGDNRYDIDYTGDEDTKIILSEQKLSVSTQQSSEVISLSDFRDNTSFNGIDGSGYSIVIMDTGIDLNHPFFGPDNNLDGISDRIIYTQDFTDDGDGTVEDVNGHGTNVASIVASSSANFTGMAPGANIIVLQVLGNDGSGSFSWVEKALQWVVHNAESYNIVATNMSLGDGSNLNIESFSTFGLSDELAALDSMGVINVAAAGNDYFTFQTEGASKLATDANVIAVSASWDADVGTARWSGGAIDHTTDEDRIISFSQRSNDVVDIVAPGGAISGAAPGGGVASMSGTSQAAPHIAGITALAQQLAEQELGRRLSAAELVTLMQTSGLAIIDGDNEDDNVTNTGDTYSRVDVEALGLAIKALSGGGGGTQPLNDIRDNVNTKATLSIGGSASSTIDFGADKDWFKVTLVQNQAYQFELIGDSSNGNALSDPWLGLHSSTGGFITSNDDGGNGLNSSLPFIASSSGDYYLSAQAYNSILTGDYILSATQTGNTIIDDYVANTGTVGILGNNSSATGEIEISGDEDWFAVTLSAGKTYTVNLEGSPTSQGTLSDTYLRGLYDSAGNFFNGTDVDDGGVGFNSQIRYDVSQSGLYYLSAGAYAANTGTYTLSIDEESNDDYASNTNTTGNLLVNSSVTGELEKADDEDWFAVSLTAGKVYTIDLEGSPTNKGTLNDTYIKGLFDSNGNLIGGTPDDDSGISVNSQVVYEATQTGTYYISAGGYGSNTGTYTLSIDEATKFDDYAANTGTNGKLNINSSASGEIEVFYDVDWFAMTLTSGKMYTINMHRSSLGDAEILGIYDSNASYISGTYDNGGVSGSDASVSFSPTSTASYYLAAAGYGSSIGTYTLDISESILDDYSADRLTAGSLSINSNITGHIETSGDEDWFAVTLTSGNVYTIDLEGSPTNQGTLGDSYLRGLFDSTGNLITDTTNDDGGTSGNSQVIYQVTQTGLYYISAGGYLSNTGTYRLSIDEENTDDYASDTGTTGYLLNNSSITGNIEESADEDWFAVTFTAGNVYTVDLKGSPTGSGTLGDTYLRGIYDANGLLISDTSNDDGGEELNSSIEVIAFTSGTYYISAGAFGADTGTYTLSIEETGTLITDKVSIAPTDAVKYEGDSGTTVFTFTVTRDGDAGSTASVDWSVTGSGSNPANTTDFTGGIFPAGTVNFATGESTKVISINVSGDLDFETDDGYLVTLSNPVNLELDTGSVSTSLTDSASGGSEVRESYYTLAGSGGDFTLSYEMYSIPDQAEIFVNGVLTATTSGLVSGTGTLTVDGATLQTGDLVLVRLTGNGDSGTAWDYTVNYSGGVQTIGYLANGIILNDDTLVVDDFASDLTSFAVGSVAVDGSATGHIETDGDEDWFSVDFIAGHTYQIDLKGSPTGSGTLSDTYLRGIYDTDGVLISGTTNDDGGSDTNSAIEFVAPTSETYYISAGGFSSNTGTYTLNIDELLAQASSFTTPISISFDDPDNELSAYQSQIIDNMQAAWDAWDFYIDAHVDASIEFVIKPIDDPDVLARAGSISTAHVQDDVWRGSVEHELIYGEDTTVADFDAEILISTGYLNQIGYYDYTPGGNTADDQISLEEVMLHEIGHALGFTGWFDEGVIHTSPYEELVNQQMGTFIGENAVATNGGPVDLDENYFHLDEETFPDSTMSTYANYGGGEEITDVEIAILADIGLPINEQYLIL